MYVLIGIFYGLFERKQDKIKGIQKGQSSCDSILVKAARQLRRYRHFVAKNVSQRIQG